MRPMMNWLPIAPDFRADLGVALESPNPTDRLERLASLAGYRLGYPEMLQLDGHSADRPRSLPPGLPQFGLPFLLRPQLTIYRQRSESPDYADG
jgi:hypothetical protein